MDHSRKNCIILLLLFLIALASCTHAGESGNGGNDTTEDGGRKYSNMYTLVNNLECMNISGAAGDVLTANEVNWVQKILDDDPNLFGAFNDPEGNTLNKTMWHGEFPGKLLSGIAQTYLLRRDEKTKAVGDQFVEALKNAQWDDGYLGPWSEKVRFAEDVKADPDVWGKWDTWGHYHCIYGLIRWYQVTGNQDALDVAVKAADCVYNYFIAGGVSIAAQKWAECNLAIGHAFALLYEETGDAKYLEAAEKIVADDWNTEYPDFYTRQVLSANWLKAALEGKTYAESGQPRWEGIYSLETLETLYRATQKEEYKTGLDSLWWSMVKSDRHNTGSFGTGEGATNNLYGNGTETCNTVAWMAFSTDYLRFSKDSYVADELEMSFFNATLGSLLEGERNFTYFNASDGTREAARITLEGHSFEGGRDMSCCQANGNRGLTQVAEWAVLTGTDGVYLNYYGECDLNTFTGSGNGLSIKEETIYPKDGNVKLILTPDKPEAFKLFVRIPSWSANTSLTVNGVAADAAEIKCGEYYVINRTWAAGDVVELSLDMTPHFWVAEKGKIGSKVSVYTGPVLLAFRVEGDVRATTRFNFSDLANLTACDGNGIVNFETVSSTGKQIRLMDYYSAGKDGCGYVSWLTCKADIPEIHDVKGSTPIWCNRE